MEDSMLINRTVLSVGLFASALGLGMVLASSADARSDIGALLPVRLPGIGGGGKDHSETQRGSKQSNREHCPVDQHGILHRFSVAAAANKRPIWRLSPPWASRRSSQLRVTGCDSSCAAIGLDSSRLLDVVRYVPGDSGPRRCRDCGLPFGSDICILAACAGGTVSVSKFEELR